MSNEQWYVLTVTTGRERRIANALQDVDITATAPSEICLQRRGGKYKQVERTLMPGYVFVKIRLVEQLYYYIRSIPGVRRFLGGGSPERIPSRDMVMTELLINDNHPLGISQGKHDGDGKLKILSGPLKELEGSIVRVDERQHRARVEIELVGKRHTFDLALVTDTHNPTITPSTKPDDPSLADGQEDHI